MPPCLWSFRWYESQLFRQFQTIQYRKELAGFQHELILLLLQNAEGHLMGSFCSLKRTADPLHQLEEATANGICAYNFMRAFGSYHTEFVRKEAGLPLAP